MTFEDLESWQQARRLTREIYVLTRKLTSILSSLFHLLSPA